MIWSEGGEGHEDLRIPLAPSILGASVNMAVQCVQEVTMAL